MNPTFTENLFYTLFNSDPDRPLYYMRVVRLARDIFINCEMPDKVTELDNMIHETLERPFRTSFLTLINAYYNPRFMYSKKAFCKIGDSVDYQIVSRYDLTLRLEKVKNWIFDFCSYLARDVRFRALQQIQR